MKTRSPSQSWPVLALVIAAVFGLSIIAAAATFSIARSTTEVSADGSRGILAEATLSAAAATLNATAQAQLVSEAAELDVVAAAEIDKTLGTAEEAISELHNRTEQLSNELAGDASITQLVDHSNMLQTLAAEAVADMREGDTAASLTIIDGDLHSEYDTLVGELAKIRNDAFSRMAVARDDAGRLADAARFLVVLLVPLAVLITFRNQIRRGQMRQELEAELEKEQLVSQTKSDFIAHLSHELRTPLTGIYGAALELNDLEVSADRYLVAELTKMITEESADLARMVEDILTVAAEDQDQLTIDSQTINPAVEIKAALEPFELIGRMTLQTVSPAGVHADPRHFRQVISNLVSNAHRYGEPPVAITGKIVSTDYLIEVIDYGDGVDPVTRDALFSRYVHKDDSPLITGTVGLGLSVANILVTRMNGTISYERTNNATIFRVRLPLTTIPR